jgi:enoyl-CoA hydratase/carnithine racemase
MSDEVLVAVDAAVATVTLNRPDRLNAVTPTMATAYAQALLALDDDPDVRVVVVTGAGRGFCAGADLGQLDQGVEHLDRHYASPDAAPDTALRIRKPVVAAVNGPVAGLGFAYLLCCDLRVVATTATMTTSFAKLGLVAEYGLSWLLPRIVGLSRATELLLSARTVDADEALRIGLAHEVVPTEEVLARAQAVAAGLVGSTSPASWAAVKEQLLADGGGTFDESMARAYGLMRRSFRGPDLVEALAARSEGRPPRFAPLPPRTAGAA